jgi:hypothetical protein
MADAAAELPKVIQLTLTRFEAAYLLGTWRVTREVIRMKDAAKAGDMTGMITLMSSKLSLEFGLSQMRAMADDGHEASLHQKLDAMADAL